MRPHNIAIAIFSGCLLLAACGNNTSATPPQQAGEESLPKPHAAAGSVTGMPNPGTPSVLPPPADARAIDNEYAGVMAEDGSVNDVALPVAPPTLPVDSELSKPSVLPAPTPEPKIEQATPVPAVTATDPASTPSEHV